MEILNLVLDFIKNTVVNTFVQIVGLLGIFFVFGFFLYLLETILSRKTG